MNLLRLLRETIVRHLEKVFPIKIFFFVFCQIDVLIVNALASVAGV